MASGPAVNPLHPEIPPEQAEGPEPANPAEEPAPASAPREPSEDYIRKLTGGKYRSAAAVWKAKQETDAAYYEQRGQLKAMKEMQRHEAANPPAVDVETLNARLENAGISPEVVGVFQEIAQATLADALAPIAEQQERRAAALTSNSGWAAKEAKMFEYLGSDPGEKEIFEDLHARDPEKAYRFGMRALDMHEAAQRVADSSPEAEEAAALRERELTHGQVVSQKFRASDESLNRARGDKIEEEEAAWARGAAIGGDWTEYEGKRLDFVDDHPGIRQAKEVS
jgi:hypothetical protein